MIDFGRGIAEAPSVLRPRRSGGFDGYLLMTTARALDSTPGAIELADAARAVSRRRAGECRGGAAVRGEVAGRPLVAFGAVA